MWSSSDPPVVFAFEGGRRLAEAIARRCGVSLAAHEERAFEDGEHKARPLVSVRGRDVFVIESLHRDGQRSVNDRLCRLLFFIGALRDAGAGRITAITPYLAYARKDRRSKSRDPLTNRYVAMLLETVGMDAIVTLDVHNVSAFENAFRCIAVNLGAAGLLVEHVAPGLAREDVAVVSPDAGGIKRADEFRARLSAILGRKVAAAFAEKYRSEGELRGAALVGDVRGKACVVVDDLISAGHTIDRAARACREHGATSVIAVATHGVFAGESDRVLAASPLEAIVVTDTIEGTRLTDPRVLGRLEVVETAPLLAEALSRLHANGSLAALTNPS
ncbi:MAG: ribose-phosphate diphosphokinase [Bacillota bacterium]